MGTDRVAELENQISELKKQLIIEKEKQAVAEDSGLWEYDVAGLYEREAATKMIEKKLFEAPDEPGALLLVDLNDFKVINDTYGRVYGDTVLEAASNIISTSFRMKDIVGRIAGDAFFIFCSGIENETAAEKLVNKILYVFRILWKNGMGINAGSAQESHYTPEMGKPMINYITVLILPCLRRRSMEKTDSISISREEIMELAWVKLIAR